ncbi:MAG: SDR family oxidoreductase [Bacteroidales bacterium]|nr:SDR family oxidoreductase [Bacteroidales bacterium]
MKVYNPFSLENKTILITGASSGIGRSIAIECSKANAKLILTARNKDRLGETFNSLTGDGHLQITADISITEDILALSGKIPELDGIVHSAGITNPLPFKFINTDQINKIFDVNFTGPALLSQNLISRQLIKRKASIVFISSISGIFCSSMAGSLYSASKGALNGLIKGMALDLAPRQIRVNAVCPGMIETDFLKDGKISENQFEEDRKRYPLKRYGRPEEVAYAVIYLLSDASEWTTGSNLLIDGGFTLL